MSFKSLVLSRIIAFITDQDRRDKRADKFEAKRKRAGDPHEVIFFHDVTDPYSHILLLALPDVIKDTDIKLTCHLVNEPKDDVVPERVMLSDYALKDAQVLATRAGFKCKLIPPSDQQVKKVRSAIAAAFVENDIRTACNISKALWSDENIPDSEYHWQQSQSEGTAILTKLGHYMGGMLYYGGEWYWGLDRLHYLETRLRSVGALTKSDTFPMPSVPASTGKVHGRLHMYFSFRSPYSYIALQRAIALTDAYGVELKLRFVLPMVMRGLPVPKSKRLYIVNDVAREAKRLGLPFGRIVDPLGKAVERGYALMPWAREQGQDIRLAQNFSTAVSSQGIDATTDKGLRRIVETAGLSWDESKEKLLIDEWSAEAEINRQELTNHSLWGVPSFRFEDKCVWGQDRMWLIEEWFQDKNRE
ncbi:2-hydroxychromene-2-carboxylate isomerase [Amylibacter sp. SFDW26]|uniref:DsbA family protein n=1 Tax=Amylibacter sp. SFDW26 TaxID=2652722 RepID=UPI0012627450|nr:DsbA family protein [Amylibacter sp. SFDW26]KAB7615760.1 2-hydroxychromene-2-carboxylate isomerase [Amylibacter sp. SFDW26]